AHLAGAVHHVQSVHCGRSRGWPQQRSEHLDGGRLAGPVEPEQPGHPARRDRQRQAVDRDGRGTARGEGLAQVLGDDRPGHAAPPRRTACRSAVGSTSSPTIRYTPPNPRHSTRSVQVDPIGAWCSVAARRARRAEVSGSASPSQRTPSGRYEVGNVKPHTRPMPTKSVFWVMCASPAVIIRALSGTDRPNTATVLAIRAATSVTGSGAGSRMPRASAKASMTATSIAVVLNAWAATPTR